MTSPGLWAHAGSARISSTHPYRLLLFKTAETVLEADGGEVTEHGIVAVVTYNRVILGERLTVSHRGALAIGD